MKDFERQQQLQTDERNLKERLAAAQHKKMSREVNIMNIYMIQIQILKERIESAPSFSLKLLWYPLHLQFLPSESTSRQPVRRRAP